MSTNNLTVSRDNRLVQSSFILTLDERRIIELAIAHIKTGGKVPDEIEITADELIEAFGVDPKNAYMQLAKGVDELYERSVEILNFDGPDSLIKFRLVNSGSYYNGKGKVIVSFTPAMKHWLEFETEQGKATGYTTYRLLHVKRLNSSHAIRMYELLMRFHEKGHRSDTLEDAKKLFGVQDKYPRWSEFERNVIRPAIKNLNQSSNYDVSYTTQKKGRKIHRINYKFKLKNQQFLEL